MQNVIYLRRRGKIVVPDGTDSELPLQVVITMVRNLENFGYTFSPALIGACRRLSLNELTSLYDELVEGLKKAIGAHRVFKPMYPGFPDSVMQMSEAELYLNAIVHYITSGAWIPASLPSERQQLQSFTTNKILTVGNKEEFEKLFGSIVSSNSSLSVQDKDDVEWFVSEYKDNIADLMADTIPQKENRAYVASYLIRHTSISGQFLDENFKTATDILRLATALSAGDASLAENTKFVTFSRPHRRLILSLLESCTALVEDMLRWDRRWIRLGEKLHPSEFRSSYPKTAEAFDIIRNNLPFTTFSRQIEGVLRGNDSETATKLLATRPGDFARRLDHVLRLPNGQPETILSSFAAVATKVSTPVLLQVMKHFEVRNNASELRVFFPKGNIGHSHAEINRLGTMSAEVCRRVSDICRNTLLERFGLLTGLGKTFVDPELVNYPTPFAARSASRSYRTLTRGSKLDMPANCKVLRFFIWWKNGRDRTDIDLSASTFDDNFEFKDVVAYYNLKTLGGVHSGDIVDAPNGASEFIDISLDKVQEQGIRYVVMTVMSYSRQPFADLPECFAGWMSREEPGSGEIYEPKTVVDKLDLTASTTIAIPLVFDLKLNKVVWCDIALRGHPKYNVHVHDNLSQIAITLQSLLNLNKPTLYDLLSLHAQARGQQVYSKEHADTIFSVENDTPFRREEIASDYMAYPVADIPLN